MGVQVLDSLRSLVSGLGTSKDKATSLQHYFCALSPDQLMAMYRSDWLARKIVDIIPNDMTREWRLWQAKGAQIEKLEAVEKAPLINAQVKVNQALQTGRLLGGAVLFIGIRNADPSQELDPRSVQQGDLQYLHVLSRYAVSGRELIQDVTSEFYGQPAFYEIAGGGGRQVKVHPSRVIPFYGAPVLERRFASNADYWSDSILQVVHDAVMNATSSQQHIAALLPEAKTDVVYIPGLAGYASTADGRAKLTARFGYANEIKSLFNMLLLDGTGPTNGPNQGGEHWEQKQISFAQLPELMRQFLQVASAAADVPATRLLGDSPGGLNSTGESDLRNYYDNIAARQATELTPALNRLDEVIIRSALGTRPRGVYYEWAPLWGLSEKEKAEVFKIKADGARALAGNGGASPSLMPIEALSDALVNTFIEDGSLPGLEAAIEEYGRLSEQEPLEGEEPEDPGAEGQPTTATDAKPRTLYISRKLVNGAEFLAWARAQGFETTVPADELHVTVAYSRSPVDWMKVQEAWAGEKDGGLTVRPGGARLVEPLGDKGAVVLLFNSSELSWRHREVREIGASWDFEDYQPHVTITYDGKGVNLEEVEPYRGKLVFGPEVFEEVDDGWATKLTEV